MKPVFGCPVEKHEMAERLPVSEGRDEDQRIIQHSWLRALQHFNTAQL